MSGWLLIVVSQQNPHAGDRAIGLNRSRYGNLQRAFTDKTNVTFRSAEWRKEPFSEEPLAPS